MDQVSLLHIFVEVAQGRGRHGDFLRSFADAYSRADDQNRAILHEAAADLVTKYGLEKYLDTVDSGAATA
jgi:hypothetical protein